jgi:hypothetical protein
MLKRLIILAIAALPAPAAALSCAEPSFVRDFWQHQASTGTYEVVFGNFSNLRSRQHDVEADNVTWQSTFQGFRASATAFDQQLVTQVTIVYPLHTGIAGGAISPDIPSNWLDGAEGVVFLLQTGDGYVATNELCSPFIYTDAADITQALNCLNGRLCPRE